MSDIKYWSHEKVRRTFLDYFKNNGHTNIKESSLIPPKNDKSLLFTNSGMVQFKSIFVGTETTELSRVANLQKCMRVGGKHNDFDNVGKLHHNHHHTLFEMMGNWSFNYDKNVSGDNKSYYKKEAIEYAWDLLTNIYGLDKSRIYITYFGGNETIPEDLETKEIWKHYIDEKRIISFGTKENFWEMATTGPCGPCTEIHYDLTGKNDASSVNKDNQDELIEIWNLVFMQYYRSEDSSLTPLEKCHVDTGAGFERLVTVLQGKMSNYETDIFQPMFDEIYKITKIPYDKSEKTKTAYRIIADHTRSITHLLYDDVFPTWENSRGEVWMKLFKRAYHYACQYLRLNRGSFTSLFKCLLEVQIKMYPYLETKTNLFNYVINAEERIHGEIIWKAVTHFNRLFEKSDKIITKAELEKLTKIQHIPLDLIEMFVRDNEFVLES